jgi:hypothetical protein
MNFALTVRSQTNVWITFEADGQVWDSRGTNRPNFFRVNLTHPLSLTVGTDLKVVVASGSIN